MALVDDRRPLLDALASPPPTLHNFVEYVETGTSADHDPLKGPESSETKKARQKLIKATLICLAFMAVELVGGFLAGSLAIMTDAAHLASDVCGFLVSLFALYLAERKPTITLSYGFKRAEIIGAILNVMIIWFLTGVLIWEAIRRTQSILDRSRSEIVDGKLMFAVACFGLLANVTLLAVLGHDHSHGPGGGHGHSHGGGHGNAHGGGGAAEAHGHSHGASHGHSHHDSHHQNGGQEHGHSHAERANGHGPSHGHGHSHGSTSEVSPATNDSHSPAENINVSAAYVHALGDLIQSVGVCIAGGLIWAFPGTEEKYYMVQLADPITTFLFSLLVLYSTYDIIKTSLLVLMEGVPIGINPLEIALALEKVPSVASVHHLHIWALSIGEVSLSVHLQIPSDADHDATLARAQHVLRSFNIWHTTIQIETVDREVCDQADCEGTPCENYALSCATDSCFEHNTSTTSNNKSNYGSF